MPYLSAVTPGAKETGLLLTRADSPEQYTSIAYGKVVVFRDAFGNKWDLIGPLAKLAEWVHHRPRDEE